MNRVYLFQKGHPFTRRQLFSGGVWKAILYTRILWSEHKMSCAELVLAIEIAVVLGN